MILRKTVVSVCERALNSAKEQPRTFTLGSTTPAWALLPLCGCVFWLCRVTVCMYVIEPRGRCLAHPILAEAGCFLPQILPEENGFCLVGGLLQIGQEFVPVGLDEVGRHGTFQGVDVDELLGDGGIGQEFE